MNLKFAAVKHKATEHFDTLPLRFTYNHRWMDAVHCTAGCQAAGMHSSTDIEAPALATSWAENYVQTLSSHPAGTAIFDRLPIYSLRSRQQIQAEVHWYCRLCSTKDKNCIWWTWFPLVLLPGTVFRLTCTISLSLKHSELKSLLFERAYLWLLNGAPTNPILYCTV